MPRKLKLWSSALLFAVVLGLVSTHSMFWVSGDDWGWRGDKPNEIASGMFPGYNYAMCVASDFDGGDSEPWSHYERGENPLVRRQADTFKAMAGVMKGTQWCSNPYIETNMAKGNCVGCHQGSPNTFLATTLTKQRGYNLSDFSFSFTTNRANIVAIGADSALTQRQNANRVRSESLVF